MRLAPVPIFTKTSLAETVRLCRESSRTTHGAEECLESCHTLGALIHHLLAGASKADALDAIKTEEVVSRRVRNILDGGYRDKTVGEVCGSGYVIHTLEAAIWSFYRTASFRDAILMAVNLGEDADTVGAVCGQIAGACYGIDGIPGDWLEKLARRELIESLAIKLHRAAESGHHRAMIQ